MDISNTFDDLFEKDFGEWLVTLLPFSHKVEEVTSRTEFHHKHDVSLRLKSLVELYDRLVSQSEEDANFVHDLRPLLVVSQVFLVD